MPSLTLEALLFESDNSSVIPRTSNNLKHNTHKSCMCKLYKKEELLLINSIFKCCEDHEPGCMASFEYYSDLKSALALEYAWVLQLHLQKSETLLSLFQRMRLLARTTIFCTIDSLFFLPKVHLMEQMTSGTEAWVQGQKASKIMCVLLSGASNRMKNTVSIYAS